MRQSLLVLHGSSSVERARARCGEDGKSQERTSQRRGRKNEQMGLATTLKNVKLKKKLQPYRLS